MQSLLKNTASKLYIIYNEFIERYEHAKELINYTPCNNKKKIIIIITKETKSTKTIVIVLRTEF